MKIGIDCGHTLSGADYGAVGVKAESVLTREVGSRVINKLKALGHNVINRTIDNSNSLEESLAYRVNQANNNDVDLFVSIHFNAYNGLAYGTEVFTWGAEQLPEATRVLNNLVGIGYANRGIKDGSNLYVIRNTKAKAMLIELFFIDSIDVELYKKVGSERLANAIVEGITGKAMPNNGNWYSLDGKLGVVTAKDGLNVRQSKSTNSKILGILKHGEKVRFKGSS
ncbi:N-acetylmuramoyl-L-alanine amidase family protein [Clostridium argentinense CDC 2741]|uniref:N-acetylmuramoyl-L-alanine amidase family protein n=1 Tax=Clostridium argentinense CDC 2741 TaxID=1418104 RepID=A0A0C1U417_9CLOT|nr:N-acetylmuramoyl-L-alanine amidase [Clostridium argentinense]ARC84564.1 N-acetylmuramoyl-L-alanine amidase [Clostridium argentinense]KIE47534.1 N-acetylmuramoyl-L-alanine amidase family protein [Clostridium argentinense CDC 2741]NFF38653.1 N-acetylmuramoyl-L-alanine amidase [Clostridium argentinense]NFP48878.1 N-acetylmuramoyl-L-alanine amidase [Clostridium argentinense]NFP72974.1 N-acetylmuramoyl-L-alanine amidase [Clostridium argentinense]